MSTSIASVSPSALRSIGADPAQRAAYAAQRFMKAFHANQDGSVAKQEFVDGLQAKGVSATDAASRFDAIDKAGSGQITKSDIETAIKSGDIKPKDLGVGRGPPGAGKGGHAGPPPQGGGATGSASSTKQYDPADTNQDGAVSMQESMVYRLSQQMTALTANPDNVGTQVDQLA